MFSRCFRDVFARFLTKIVFFPTKHRRTSGKSLWRRPCTWLIYYEKILDYILLFHKCQDVNFDTTRNVKISIEYNCAICSLRYSSTRYSRMSRYRLSMIALYMTCHISRLEIAANIALFVTCDISWLGIVAIIALFITCDITRLEFVSIRVLIDSRYREILDTSARVSIDSHEKFIYEYSTIRNNFRHVLLEIISILNNAFIYDSVYWYIDHVTWHNHVL